MRPIGSGEELERRRRRALGLLKSGLMPVDVASRVGVDRRSVRRWKAAARDGGEQAVRARPTPGRPTKLLARDRRRLAALLLKGARVAGRLDQVVCRDYPFGHCYVAIVPMRIDFENKTGVFAAVLDLPALERTMQTMFTNLRPEMRLPPAELGMASKGSSLILLRGTRPKVTSGYSMVWRTLEGRTLEAAGEQ